MLEATARAPHPTPPAGTAARALSRRAELAILALITLIGLAVRAATLDESLLGDELFTYDIATRGSIGEVFDGITETELNPPLYFVLAWLAAKAGDPTIAIRIPAFVLGVASIPLVWLVGRRLVGSVSALIGTGLFAIAPFAAYYGSEARAYSTLTFFALASTYALLRGLGGGSRWWWAAYAAASAAVMYTHYTGGFVLAVQAAWAIWAYRERWRAVVIACGAAAVAYIPWVPYIRENVPVDIIEIVFPLTPRNFVRGLGRLFPGHPYAGIDQVPGRAALALIFLGVGVAAAVAIARAVRARRAGTGVWPSPSRGVLLVGAIAVASPLGAVVADWAGQPIYLPRNLIASLPAMCLLLGLLIARQPRPAALAAGALVFLGLGIGMGKALQAENGRPQYKAAAQWVDDRARPGDPVAQAPGFRSRGVLADAFAIHFDKPHPLFTIDAQSRDAVALARRRGRLFVITLRAADVPPSPVPGPPLRLVARRAYPGILPIEALEYAAP